VTLVNRIQLATAGLFVAWMLHDLEELATMSDNSRAVARRLPVWIPLPASIRQRGLTTRHVATGVAAIGLVIAAATVRGYRTQGRSALYQNTLLGFGLHGLGHIGMSLLAGGYTSGVATSPTVVVPFWLWATPALQQAGVPNRRSLPAAMALVAGSLAGGHLAAYLITKNHPGTDDAAARGLTARRFRRRWSGASGDAAAGIACRARVSAEAGWMP
jgi:hypothetical protein